MLDQMQNNEGEAALQKSEADAVDEEPQPVNPDDNTELSNNEEEAVKEVTVAKSESDVGVAAPVAEDSAEGNEAAAAAAETEEEPLTIVLIGMAGVGKSTAINRMLTSIDSDRDTVQNLIEKQLTAGNRSMDKMLMICCDIYISDL